ncbi:MAG: hypothetical protein Q7P63_03030 [Verrucomicrobiota bacterium JB022]|nr:hypothetical protein [Verrucomicrobiota bacterium JB022]
MAAPAFGGAMVVTESLSYTDGERTLHTEGGSLFLTGASSNSAIQREVDLEALPNPVREPAIGTNTFISFLARRSGEAADPNNPVYGGNYPYGDNLYPRSAGIGLLSWNDEDLLQLFLGNLSNRPDDVWRFTGEDIYGDDRRDARSSVPFGAGQETRLVVMQVAHGAGGWNGDRVRIWIDPNMAGPRFSEPPVTFDWTSRDDPLIVQPAVIALEANNSNALRPHAELSFDELRIGDSWEAVTPHTGGQTWAGRPLVNSRLATGENFLGWLEKSDSEWFWSWDLDSWIFIPEGSMTSNGSWFFMNRTGLEAPERVDVPSILLAYEGFDYIAGQQLVVNSLDGGTGWVGPWVAAEPGPQPLASVQEASLEYTDEGGYALATTGGHAYVSGDTGVNTNVRRTLSEPVAAEPGNTVYMSFIGQRVGEPTDLSNPLWSDTSIYPNGYPWGDNLYPRGAGLNIFSGDSGTDTSAMIGNLSDQLINQWSFNSESTHFIDETAFTDQAFIVVRLTYTAHQEVNMVGEVVDLVGTVATFWVNPRNLLEEDASDAIRDVALRDLVTPNDVAMQGLGLHAGNDSYYRPVGEFLADELRVGTDWHAVTPVQGGKPTPEVPAPTYWAGMEIVDGYVWAGSELRWLWVDSAPWLYSHVLNAWVWVEEEWMQEDSHWLYIPDSTE